MNSSCNLHVCSAHILIFDVQESIVANFDRRLGTKRQQLVAVLGSQHSLRQLDAGEHGTGGCRVASGVDRSRVGGTKPPTMVIACVRSRATAE